MMRDNPRFNFPHMRVLYILYAFFVSLPIKINNRLNAITAIPIVVL